jgi:hypothetical protein
VRTRLQCLDRLLAQLRNGARTGPSCAGADCPAIDWAETVATADRVKGLVAAWLEDLCAADFALAAISDHYIRGHPIVLVDQEERLRELIDVAEKFGQLFNAVVNAENALGESLTAPIDVDRVKHAAKEHSKIIATALIDAAKRRTLLLLSDPEDAVKALMENLPAECSCEAAAAFPAAIRNRTKTSSGEPACVIVRAENRAINNVAEAMIADRRLCDILPSPERSRYRPGVTPRR